MSNNETMKTRKVGSGRKKGSFCFMSVTLGELNRVLKPEASIMVSKKFAESIGLDGVETHASPQNNSENNLDNGTEMIVNIVKEW